MPTNVLCELGHRFHYGCLPLQCYSRDCISTFFVAQPCDQFGRFLPFNSPPPNLDENPTYAPFEDREAFELAELLFTKAEMSKGNINSLLDIWGRRNTSQGLGEDSYIFSSADEMYKVIDSVTHGSAPWKSVYLQYSGPIDADMPN